MAKSPEYKAFRRKYSYLRNTLSANAVVPLAFERGLLTRSEKKAALHPTSTDEERNDRLLDAIEKRILASREGFYKFMEVLRAVDDAIARELSASYHEVMSTHHGSPASSPQFAPYGSPASSPQFGPYGSPASSPLQTAHYGSSVATHEMSPGVGVIAQAMPSLVSSHPNVIHGRVDQPLGDVRQPIQAQSTGQNFMHPFQESRQLANLPTSLVTIRHSDWFSADGVLGTLQTDGGELDVEYYKASDLSGSRKRETVRLSTGEVKVVNLRYQKHSPYSMQRFPHGVAVIINNERFDSDSLKIREGTAIDEENLVQTFRYLCYNIEVYRNCTSAQIMEVFKKVRLRDHWQFDSFVCCILSHGEEGKVFGSDGKPVVLNEVTAMLSARNCNSLAGKPKMFFIQACRGDIKDPVVRVVCDSEDKTSRLVCDGAKHEFYVPNEAEFFFSYSSPPGHATFRDTESGSWYISELCHVLCQSSTYLHLDDMMKDVHRNLGRYFSVTKSGEQCRQVGELTHRLQNNVYFF